VGLPRFRRACLRLLRAAGGFYHYCRRRCQPSSRPAARIARPPSRMTRSPRTCYECSGALQFVPANSALRNAPLRLQRYPISSDRRRHRLPRRRSQTITGGKYRHRQEGKLPHGAVEIDGVPVHDGCGNRAETGGAEALVLKRTVTDLALAMEEHRAAHLIAGLALVQPGMAVLAQVGV